MRNDGAEPTRPMAADPRRRRLAAAIFLAVVAVAAGVAGALYLVDPAGGGWAETVSPKAFRELILSWGMWGVAASILLMVVHSFIPFPAEFVAVANGMCLGLVWGTVITWIGAMLGAMLAFALSRAFGRPWVERMIRRRHWDTLDDWSGRRGGEVVLVCRFIPLIAFNLINYAAGLSRMSYVTFFWATAIGILPMTALMVVLGAKMYDLAWWAWLGIVVAGMALWLLASHVLTRLTTRDGPADSE